MIARNNKGRFIKGHGWDEVVLRKISETKTTYPTKMFKCECCSKEFISKVNKHHPTRRFCTITCSRKIVAKTRNYSLETRKMVSKRMLGEGNHRWRGGYTLKRRLSTENAKNHKIWREAVFKRDNYTCQKCGTKGIYLQADHIKPWALFIDLRWELNNGQTLCRKCHGKKTALEHRLYWKNQYGSFNSFHKEHGYY